MKTQQPLSGHYLDVARVGVEELSDDQQEEVHLIRPLVNLGERREIQFTFSGRLFIQSDLQKVHLKQR